MDVDKNFNEDTLDRLVTFLYVELDAQINLLPVDASADTYPYKPIVDMSSVDVMAPGVILFHAPQSAPGKPPTSK